MFKHPSVSLLAFALFAAVGMLGCGPVKTAGNTVIDCLAADRAKIDATLADLATKTNPDGTRDWSAIEADATSAGLVIGGCALAELVEAVLNPTQRAQTPPDRTAARQTLEHFRSTQAGNATFKTRLGTL